MAITKMPHHEVHCSLTARQIPSQLSAAHSVCICYSKVQARSLLAIGEPGLPNVRFQVSHAV